MPQIDPERYLGLQDLPPEDDGGPKGPDFDLGIRSKKKMLVPLEPWTNFQDGHPNPQMGFLMWLLSKLRGGLWGQPERPDMLMDDWLQRQMQRPQLPKRWT